MNICHWHLCNSPIEKNRKYCSVKCKNKNSITEWRKRSKQLLVEYKGGCCVKCGYAKCLAALQFHHEDPTQKEFGLSWKGRGRSLEKLKKEVDKCLLLCANCHAEEHDRLRIYSREADK